MQTLTRRQESANNFSQQTRHIEENKENVMDNAVDMNDLTQSTETVDKKIKLLMENVCVQQHHISQATNALNTCAATFEFSGSMESVIAEWKLLVASEFSTRL